MQRKRSLNSGRIIDMKHYTVEITNEALAERIGIMESELSIRYSSFSIRYSSFSCIKEEYHI